MPRLRLLSKSSKMKQNFTYLHVYQNFRDVPIYTVIGTYTFINTWKEFLPTLLLEHYGKTLPKLKMPAFVVIYNRKKSWLAKWGVPFIYNLDITDGIYFRNLTKWLLEIWKPDFYIKIPVKISVLSYLQCIHFNNFANFNFRSEKDHGLLKSLA